MESTREISVAMFAAISLLAMSSVVSAATCDRACLLAQAKQFNAAMLAHTPEKIQHAPDAQIRENTKAITLADSKWSLVKRILSEAVFADPMKGNVVERVAGQTVDGKGVYVGTRLKVVNGEITEVEINFDDGVRVNLKNLVPYDCTRRRKNRPPRQIEVSRTSRFFLGFRERFGADRRRVFCGIQEA